MITRPPASQNEILRLVRQVPSLIKGYQALLADFGELKKRVDNLDGGGEAPKQTEDDSTE